jgi:phosphatidylglycerol---prolipoprotein diacylglyceryl transferase
VQTWKGGMAFHGGLLGAIAGLLLYARRSGAPALTVSDLCAGVAPIGLFFGRIANFIKPEMWGRETDVPWAMVFPGAGDAPRHPSQLYEAGLEGVALFLLLLVAMRFGALKRPGLTSGLFGMGYGAARIFCEFFREPDPVQEALAGGFTMGMALSAPMIVIGAALALYALRGGREARR